MQHEESLSTRRTTHHKWARGKHELTHLLSGWECVRPNLCLIHSLTAPAELVAPGKLPRRLPLHSRHFARPPNYCCWAQVGQSPNSQIHALSLRRGSFSPRLQTFSFTSLSASSSGADVGEVGKLRTQLDPNHGPERLFAFRAKTKSKRLRRLRELVETLSRSNIRPVLTVRPRPELLQLPQTCVLQLLDRKLQSAAFALPPGYKLAGLSCTVI